MINISAICFCNSGLNDGLDVQKYQIFIFLFIYFPCSIYVFLKFLITFVCCVYCEILYYMNECDAHEQDDQYQLNLYVIIKLANVLLLYVFDWNCNYVGIGVCQVPQWT